MSLCLGVSLRMRAMRPVAHLTRCFFASSSVKETRPSIQAIAELRKALPGTSMLKAREAVRYTGLPAVADDGQLDLGVDATGVDEPDERLGRGDRAVVDPDDEVALAQTGASQPVPGAPVQNAARAPPLRA